MKQLTQDKYFIFDRPREDGLAFRLKCAMKRAYWSFRYAIIRKRPYQERKYAVSVCTIFKNEAEYLREWIEFHRIVGVDHFYLYNNNSEDDFHSILNPYIEEGVVTLVEWPHDQAQMECYANCVERFASETRWLGFIDVDEFIVPRSTEDIYSFLQPFEDNRGAVLIYWRLFGTSGYITRDISQPVVEDFTVCWPKYCDIGKVFLNTRFKFDAKSKRNAGLHHRLWVQDGKSELPPVNIFNEVATGAISRVKSSDFPIQINHYFTKSYDEYRQKMSKGDVFFKMNPHTEQYFYDHEKWCMATDYSAYRFLIKLKLRLEECSNEGCPV